jgi:hypothetical protein
LDRPVYNPIAISIPFTFGAKYALNARTNVFAELIYRFTNTDFLDDVSGQTYAPDAFAPLPDGSPSPAFLLQDRSYETGASIGVKGRQRGNSLKADAFRNHKSGYFLQFTELPLPYLLVNKPVLPYLNRQKPLILLILHTKLNPWLKRKTFCH